MYIVIYILNKYVFLFLISYYLFLLEINIIFIIKI